LSRLWISTKNLPLAVLWESTNTNLDSFGIGILCAVLQNGSIPKFSRWARIALFIDGLALFVSAGTIDPEHQFPFAAFSFPVATVGSLLLFLALCGSSLKLRPLVYLGKISYGLYVYHKLALTIAGLIIGKDRFPLFWMAGLAITITLAPLSYRFLESPFLHLKGRFAVIASRPV
jgi:peptidoglycan/LPS O-acetylase OafA/YrhL